MRPSAAVCKAPPHLPSKGSGRPTAGALRFRAAEGHPSCSALQWSWGADSNETRSLTPATESGRTPSPCVTETTQSNGNCWPQLEAPASQSRGSEAFLDRESPESLTPSKTLAVLRSWDNVQEGGTRLGHTQDPQEVTPPRHPTPGSSDSTEQGSWFTPERDKDAGTTLIKHSQKAQEIHKKGFICKGDGL